MQKSKCHSASVTDKGRVKPICDVCGRECELMDKNKDETVGETAQAGAGASEGATVAGGEATAGEGAETKAEGEGSADASGEGSQKNATASEGEAASGEKKEGE